MRSPSWLSYLILFSLFFPIGFWTGSQLSTHSRIPFLSNKFQSILPHSKRTIYPLPSDPESNQQIPSWDPKVQRSQTNTLILFVDNLAAQEPKLTSAWLLIQPKDSSRLIFLPIFQEPNPDLDLITAFQLDHKQLNNRFVKTIEERNLLWHFFIILDQTTQKQILANGDISKITNFIPANFFLKWVCDNLPQQPQAISQLKPFVPNHLFASFDIETSLGMWQHHLSTQPNLTCEFPTLSQ